MYRSQKRRKGEWDWEKPYYSINAYTLELKLWEMPTHIFNLKFVNKDEYININT